MNRSEGAGSTRRGWLTAASVAAALSLAAAAQPASAQDERPQRGAPEGLMIMSSDGEVIEIERDSRGNMQWTRAGRGGPFGRGMEFPNLLQPDFAHRDLAILSQHLELDRSQRTILQMLLEDYLTSFEQEADALREAVAQIREARQQAREQAREHMREAMREARAEGGEREAVAIRDQDGEPIVLTVGDTEVRIVISDGFRVTAEATGGGVEGTVEIRNLDSEDRARIGAMVRERVGEIDEETREELRQRMAERREQAREARRQMRQMREEALAQAEAEGIGPSLLRDAGQSFRSAKSTMREQFVDDIMLILNDRQAERWQEAEQLRFRLHMLPRGQRPGEQINLVRIVEELTLPSIPDHEMYYVMQEYKANLDRALRDRAEFLENADIRHALASLRGETGEQMRLRGEESRKRAAVERVHINAVEQLAALAEDPDDAETLRQALREHMYPHVYQASRVDRAVAHALELEDLDEAVRAQVNLIHEDYQQQARVLNDRMVESIEAMREAREQWMEEMLQEAAEGAGDPAGFRGRGARNIDFSSHREIMLDQRNLLQQTMQSLERVLGERYEDLPEAVRQTGGDRGRQAREAMRQQRGAGIGRGDGRGNRRGRD